MHPHDEQPTTAFPTSALRAPTTTKRHRWLLVAVITAVVAAVIAIVMAFTIPDESQPTVAGRNSSNVPGAKPDKKAHAAARQAWAHQYGIDPKTSTDLPDVASATDAQRQAAIDLLSRTEAAPAGWSDLDAAKEAGFDVAAQLAEAETRNDKIVKRIAEVDARGPGRHLLTLAVTNKSNVKNAQVLDPSVPQALLYAYQGKGAWKVIGARFLADKLCPAAPPTPGGPITRWAYDKGNNLSLRIFFVAGNDLQHAYALKRPEM